MKYNKEFEERYGLTEEFLKKIKRGEINIEGRVLGYCNSKKETQDNEEEKEKNNEAKENHNKDKGEER